ncbi:ATP-binding protein [Thiofilum flexile]|uniref:ATP-binding protein n=1 Tax=Thiofilum flexile TaxID=125627 RepID=UPI0003826A87|nr:ATP-binding protein [Thiofilum flexile]
MSSSLRSRQLVSGFSIIVVGILVLGVLLHLSLYERKKEESGQALQSTALTLLGYLEFDHGYFKITDNLAEEAANFISNGRLDTSGERERFAYIYDLTTQQVVWTSHDRNNISDSIRAVVAYFDFDKIREDEELKNAKPKSIVRILQPVNKPNANGTPSNWDNSNLATEYQVALQRFTYSYGDYIFVVAQSLEAVNKEMSDLRVRFAVLFFVSVVLILIAQLASSFWVVSPIKEFEEEVHSIQLGEQELITDDYPEELTPIKNTINALISHESGQKQRYKDSLDDLAHSLKTPLAAIRSQIEVGNQMPERQQEVLTDIIGQVDYMQEIISRQLRKAMVTSHSAIIISQPIRPILLRLAETMKKVYRDKTLEIRILVDDYAKCRLDAEDLMELMGNLISNACRFCDQLVEVSAHIREGMLIVDIDDDGMGFPSENPSKLLQRGIREDSKSEGQGIGLAVSTEIIAAVGGRIELLVSPQVGARVRLHLPI